MTAAKLKAIIFDMDDTLVDWSRRSQNWRDYEREHLQLVFEYVAREIHPITMFDEFCDASYRLLRDAWRDAERGLRAPNRGAVMAKALEAVGVPPERIDIEACLRAYDWRAINGVAAYPDVAELLPLLVDSGIKIGLITNADLPMWMRDAELEAFGLLGHFADCRISAADFGYLKPHPAIFEGALRCLGCRVDEAVFIGDNPVDDIAGAQSLGMRAVLRVGSKAPPLISGLIIPDGAINTLHELLPLLDRWYPDWRAQPKPGDVDVTAVNTTVS